MTFRPLMGWLAVLICGLLACSDSTDDNAETSTDTGVQTETDTASEADTAPTPMDTGGTTPMDTGMADVDEPDPGTTIVMDPQGSGFFHAPIPSDIRVDAQGRPQVANWPVARDTSLLATWFLAADSLLEGWGLVSAMHMWFTAPIDPTTLPTALSNTTDPSSASVLLVDVDPDSPEQGRLLPVECTFIAPEGTMHPGNMLSCRSPLGVVRRPATTYALVLTDRILDMEGQPIGRPLPLRALLRGEALQTRYGTRIMGLEYQAALAQVEALGVEAERVAVLNLFTTHDPTARLRSVASWYDQRPDPELPDDVTLEVVETWPDYIVVQGAYDVPVIQQGARPYAAPPDGVIVMDEEGVPVQQDTQRVRFFLTLPRNQPMPDGGWPVLGFMHGSGGRAEQLMDRGAQPDPRTPPPEGSGPASVVAPYGIAGFSSDFPLHGTRHNPPDTTGLLLYNIIGNAPAAIDGFIVGACEIALHARLLRTLTLDPALSDDLDPGDDPEGLIRFNVDRLTWMGQSMGSNIGLVAMSIDKLSPAIILSGSGGGLVEIAVTSSQPVNIAGLLAPTLGYRPDEVLDQFDPLLNIVQTVWDLVDTFPHARHLIREPHPGIPAKHVLQHSGLTDGYFSPVSRASLATALGTELVTPVYEPLALELMALEGLGESSDPPLQGNGPDGMTAVSVQYEPDVLDGHHVAYQRDDAKAQYACFVRSLRADAAPTFRSVEGSERDACLMAEP